MAWEDIFKEWLEQTEAGQRAQYMTALTGARERPQPASTRTPGFMSYWQPEFGNLQSQYMAPYAEQMRQNFESTGEMGDLDVPGFGDWLKEYDFARQWRALAPYQRGERPQTFAPRMRHSFY